MLTFEGNASERVVMLMECGGERGGGQVMCTSAMVVLLFECGGQVWRVSNNAEVLQECGDGQEMWRWSRNVKVVKECGDGQGIAQAQRWW